MKIVHLSDTHRKCHPELKITIPDGDTLIHSGDWSMSGTHDDLIIVAKWLGSMPHANKIVIAGNHDKIAERDPSLTRDTFEEEGVIYLQDEEVSIGGIRIWGSPWSNQFGNWSFMRNETGLGKIYGGIPEGIDVIVSHGPAHGILDAVLDFHPPTSDYIERHVGSTELRKAIDRVNPQYVLCGHIHEAYGNMKCGNVTYLNSSVLDERYRLKNAPQVFEIVSR